MGDQPPGRRVTLKNVARAVGLSHSAVSLALRNSRRIPKATCERVQKAARELGYEPNPMAAGLAQFKRTSKIVPVQSVLAWLNLWPDPKQLRSFREFEGYWRGAAACAEKFGYRLEEFVCHASLHCARLEKILLARGIQGILLPPFPSALGPEWADFHWEYFSVVRLGRSFPTPHAHLVTADQVVNTLQAFERMQALGYRRIGMVEEVSSSIRGRHFFKAGFLLAQSKWDPQAGIPVLGVDCENPAASLPKLARWMKRYKPEALLSDERITAGLLKRCGYRIPEDVGLAATSVLDGNAEAGIDQNPEEIGRVAVLVLISLINDNARGIPPIARQVLIEGRWVDGSSLPRR